MRFIILLAILFLQLNTSSGQTSLKHMNLNQGEYTVGFLHYTAIDSTRTYSRIYDFTNTKIARPIPVSIWYPSKGHNEDISPLKIVDYMEILKEEEEWEHLPNEHILNWFYYANSTENRKHLSEPTTAYEKAEFANDKFPVVVYAPSYQASSIENFALCEYLASHGLVVISSPSRGTETRWFSSNNPKEMETQARDVEFLLKEVAKFTMADYSRIAVMGFSFGGLSNMIAQSRNNHIKAVVSLDGTERYQFGLLNKSPFFDTAKMNVPYVHMAQKSIPENVLTEDHIDPVLNVQFQLYDSISKSQAYRLRFNNLTHSYFSTLGVLFATRDERQDKSDSEIMQSYALVTTYTLNFLQAFLGGDQKARRFMDTKPEKHGIQQGIIEHQFKQAQKSQLTFKDFNDMASKEKYKNLQLLFENIKEEHPSFMPAEAQLNTLGNQLVYNINSAQEGIRVFVLATSLYPNSSNLFDSLAEGYLFLGETDKAILSFEESLRLNAENQNAINRLVQLRK